MDAWDVALLAAASYCSVVTLVRMMRARRDQAVRELREQVERERERQLAAARQHKPKQSAATRKEAA